MKQIKTALFVLLLLPLALQAAKVDTITVHSPSMRKGIKVVVISPDASYGQNAVACPVIYLLHGYSGNEKTWLGIKPGLPRIADEKGIIFVCPDGKNSWYWDSPKDPLYRYETFVSSELVKHIDANYHTVAGREGRAITGLSMGGHGGMWLSVRRKDVFGAGGSMSGGLDIRPFPKNWQMSAQLGDIESNPANWKNYTAINQLGDLENGELAIIIDCGLSDFFLQVNKDFHDKLVERKIDHDFILRPGGHNSAYWSNALDYQVLFFDRFFGESN